MILKRAAGLASALVVFAGVSLAAITTIEGTVTGDDGNPLKDAVIKIERVDITGHYHTKTDKKGHYFYGGLPLGTFNVCVEVDGRQRDCVNKLRTTTSNSTDASFNLKAKRDQDQALSEAAQSGTLTKEQEKQLSPEMRAALNNINTDLVQQHPDYVCRVTATKATSAAATCSAFRTSKPAPR